MLRRKLMLRWTSLLANRLPKGIRRQHCPKSTGDCRLEIEPLEQRQMLTTITVTTTADTVEPDGLVSLREAILAANSNFPVGDAPAGMVGLDTIEFNIDGAGPHTIAPTMALPSITEAIIIDGYTQPGATAGPHADLRIELDGSGAGGADGLEIDSGGSTIRGLAINRFSGDGIQINTPGGNTIEGNFIGTDVAGVIPLGNGANGVEIVGSANNLVGGVALGSGNVIAYNGGKGVEVSGVGASGNAIRRNSIFENTTLGIDLIGGGVTPNDLNDPDLGPNNLQNFPVFIGTASQVGSSVQLTYSVPSIPPNSAFPLEVEFFVADVDMQEGQTYFATDIYSAGLAPNDKTITVPAIAGLADSYIVATATDAEGNTSEFSAPVQVVKTPDRFEVNNSIATATILGSEVTVIEQDLSIHEEADEDFLKITAHDTGKLVIRTFFMHDDGDLQLEVWDMLGNVILAANDSSTTVNMEEVVIPVATKEMYFVRVTGVDGAINCYDLEIENFPAPIPEMPVLHPNDDDGISGTDNITGVQDPRIFIQADLTNFALWGIDILTAEEAAAGESDGAAVEVFVNGVSQGFADPVGSSNTLFEFQLDSDALAMGLPVDGGALNFVTAAIRMFDGYHDDTGEASPNSGRTLLSKPLELVAGDVEGPRVNDLRIADYGEYDLFDPKPSEHGPTPPIRALVIEFIDYPPRTVTFTDAAVDVELAENEAFYSLFGDATGHIPILSAEVIDSSVATGSPATTTVLLTFFEPLPDDRIALTVFDTITDPAGNQLDGESNAVQPSGEPTFPSGNGVPGANFVARFTVDSRAEIGNWWAGTVLVDTNGNFLADPTNSDFTNRDIAYRAGFDSDYIFAGKFSVREDIEKIENEELVAPFDSAATGFDTLASYGRVISGGIDRYRWAIDTDDNGVADYFSIEPAGAGINGYPVAGNFDGVDDNGDEVGLFDGTNWYFDTDRDFIVSDNAPVTAINYSGFPIAGDFDGDLEDDNGDAVQVAMQDVDHDGDDDVATYIATSFGGNLFSVDLNTAGPGARISIDGIADYSFSINSPNASGLGFAGVRERPVAADFNADGIDDFGLWFPDGVVPVPDELGEWFLVLSGDDPFTENSEVSVLDRIENGPLDGYVPFSPEPFGNDLYAQFGNTFSLPIAGNFDPPVTSSTSTSSPAPASQPLSVPEIVVPSAEQAKTALLVEPTAMPLVVEPAPADVPTASPVTEELENEPVMVLVVAPPKLAPQPPVEVPAREEPRVPAPDPVVVEQPEPAPAIGVVASQTPPPETPITVASQEAVDPQTPSSLEPEQVPVEVPQEVIAPIQTAVVEANFETRVLEVPEAVVDPPIPSRFRSRVRSLSFGSSHVPAHRSTASTVPPADARVDSSSLPEVARVDPTPAIDNEEAPIQQSIAAPPAQVAPVAPMAATVVTTDDVEAQGSEPTGADLAVIDSAFAAVSSQFAGPLPGEVGDELAQQQLQVWQEVAARHSDDATFEGRRYRSLHGFSWSG